MRTISAAASGPFDRYPHWRGSTFKASDPLTSGQESGLKRLVLKLKQMDVKDKIQRSRRGLLRHLWFTTEPNQSFARWKRMFKRGQQEKYALA